jgi:hypothetical protein
VQLTYSAAAEEFRATVRAFLAEALPDGWRGLGSLDAEARVAWRPAWRAALREHGLLVPGWPEEYGGGGRDLISESILAEELARVGTTRFPLPTDSPSLVLLGPTLLQWGTDEQKSEFLPARSMERSAGPRDIPSRKRGRICSTSAPAPFWTATSGSSTGKRSGSRARYTQTGSSPSCALELARSVQKGCPSY